jgi:hypothetical protein
MKLKEFSHEVCEAGVAGVQWSSLIVVVDGSGIGTGEHKRSMQIIQNKSMNTHPSIESFT